MFPFTADVAHAMGANGAAAVPATGNPVQDFLGSPLPMLVAMFAIFYFLLIRPQQKKAKEHKAMLEALKKGDNVITAGGVHGKVTAVENDIVTLEVANNVNIKITKSYIAAIKKD